MLSSHLADLESVVIAPLFTDRRAVTAAEVAIKLGEESYVLSLIDIASTPPSRLRRQFGSIADQEYEIRRGLDRVFSGF